MKVLIGIPSFRRPGLLAEALSSLERLTGLDGVSPEVFVADNDPAGADAAALCERLAPGYRWPLRAAVVAEKGISAARNRILDEASRRGAAIIAMIDDDETACPEWLARLLAARARHRADAVGGPVAYDLAGEAPAGLAASGAFRRVRRDSGPVPLLTSSANMLLDRAALDRLGGPRFDARFGLTGGEDKEFFTRLARGGVRFAWADDALVREHVPARRLGVAAILRRAYAIGGSDYHIDALHGHALACPLHLLRSAAVLLSAAPLAPALLLPRFRLALLRRHARALGRIASAFGGRAVQYGATVSPGTSISGT